VLSSASAAKVYRSGGPEACQEALARLDAGACLEWLPREAIVFDGARWRQALRVELAADAVFLGSEIVRFGRTARDERFTHGSFRSQLEVWRAGEPLWVERAHLPPAARDGALGLAGQPVVGTLVWAGRPAEPALVAALRALPAPPGAGLTRALAGLVARYRGNDPAAARAWFQALWPVLREASGRPGNPCLPL
jgi:urease accessory protein